MAFPVVASTERHVQGTNATVWTVLYPSGLASGDLVIAIVSADGAATFTWDELTELNQQGAGLGPCTASAYRIATGTEGADFVITLSASEKGVVHVYRITGWHGTTPPEVGTLADGDSLTANPPSVTPSWGAEDTLWLMHAAADTQLIDGVSSYPTNYTTNGIFDQSGSLNSDAGLASSYRTANAASEDPGVLTWTGAADNWIAGTIAVRPAAGGAAYTISGAVTIATTIAATLLEGRVLAGAVTVATAVAGTMLEGRVLAGAVGVSITPAAAMSATIAPVDYMTFLTTSGIASTADIARLDVVGDIEMRVRVALNDYTVTGDQNMIVKYVTTGNQRAYLFQFSGATGLLRLLVSAAGTGPPTVFSVTTSGLIDAGWYDFRVTLDLDNGASNSEAKFYQRADLSAALTSDTGWTQISTTQTGSVLTGIFNSTAPLEVPGGATPALGKHARALVYNGIGGTIVSDLNFEDPANRVGGQNDEWTDDAPTASNVFTLAGVESTDWSYTQAAGGAEIAGAVPVTIAVAATLEEGRVLSGSVPVSVAVAASMVEGRTIAGAVPLSIAVAGGMLEGRVLAGQVPVAITPAATMEEGRVLAGAVPVAVAVAGTMLEGRVLAGAVPVTVTPAAEFAEGRHLEGAVPVSIGIEATMLEGRVLSGDVPVPISPAATLEFTATNQIVGAVPVTITPAAEMLEGRVVEGQVPVAVAVSGSMEEGRVLAGAVSVAVTPAGEMLEGRVLAGAVTIPITPAAAFEEGRVLAGQVTVAVTPQAEMLEGRVLSGAVPISTTIAAALDFTAGANEFTITGAVPIAVSPAASMLEGRVLSGAVSIPLAISGTMLEGRTFAGSVTLTILPAADTSLGHQIAGSIGIPVSVQAVMLEGRVIVGDVLIPISVTGEMLEGRTIAGDVTITIIVGGTLLSPVRPAWDRDTRSVELSTADLRAIALAIEDSVTVALASHDTRSVGLVSQSLAGVALNTRDERALVVG